MEEENQLTRFVIRIDYSDVFDRRKFDKFIKILVKKYQAKYLLSPEIGASTGKPHMQGWIDCTKDLNSFRSHWNPYYKTTRLHETHLELATNLISSVTYIVNNIEKPKPRYEDLVTNYSLEEYQEFLDESKYPLFKPIPKKKRKTQSSWWDNMLDVLRKECVYENEIIYARIPETIVDHPLGKKFTMQELEAYSNAWIHRLELETGDRVLRHEMIKHLRRTSCRYNHTLDQENLIFLKSLEDNKNAETSKTNIQAESEEGDKGVQSEQDEDVRSTASEVCNETEV